MSGNKFIKNRGKFQKKKIFIKNFLQNNISQIFYSIALSKDINSEL